MECVQLDLSSHELQNIWAIKFAKNSSINKNSRYAYKLPAHCNLENCFIVGIWFGDLDLGEMFLNFGEVLTRTDEERGF